MTLAKKPGMISYMPNISLNEANGLIHAIQIITTKAPVTIPLNAPMWDKPFQYSESITKGLNAAPNPAQALPTRCNIVSLGDQASKHAIIATNKTHNLTTS